MKLNRKLFFRIHSWVGIKLSILFFIVCLSGTMATLSNELDWLFIPEIRAENHGMLASKNEIVANIAAAYPEGTIAFWGGAAAPYMCDVVYVLDNGKQWFVFANPYTGAVQGAAALTFQRFFRDLHYFLFIPFQIGHFTVLIFGFMLFISTATALLFYKKWYTKLFTLKLGGGRVAFYRSLHRLVGVWSVPFAILFSITGIWYFIERTNIGGVSTIANTRPPDLAAAIDSAALDSLAFTFDYDRAAKAATAAIDGLVVKDILIPNKPNKPFYLNGTSGEPLVRNRANRIYVHPATYAVVGTQKATRNGTITWLNDIADPLHFGYWGGLATKIIWFFGGLCISGLVLTGLYISAKRKVKNRQKAQAQRMGRWKYANYGLCAALLFFMYYFLVVRYHMPAAGVALVTLAWMGLALAWWYVFVYKIRQSLSG